MSDVAPSEPPSQAATTLAAQRSLGNWLFTVEAKKGFGLKKWRDSRLYMYHNGAVITGPDGYMAAYEWYDARILQNLRTVNGVDADARYTLIDPNGAAVSIGFGSWAFIGRQKERYGVTSHVQGAPFLYPHDWGRHIQASIRNFQLPDVLARIERGETIDFGVYRADKQGVSGSKHRAAWEEITQLGYVVGKVCFNGSQKRTTVDSEPTSYVVNLDLFMKLCHRLAPIATS